MSLVVIVPNFINFATKMSKPKVFMDISAAGKALGRIVIEVFSGTVEFYSTIFGLIIFVTRVLYACSLELMSFHGPPKISVLYAPVKRDSDTRVVHSIALSLISCAKEEILLKEMVQEENRSTETNSPMRTSH